MTATGRAIIDSLFSGPTGQELTINNGKPSSDRVLAAMGGIKSGCDDLHQALEELVNRSFARRCRNPRDGATERGCQMDHSFEMPELDYTVFDAALFELASLIWLLQGASGFPSTGPDSQQVFSLRISRSQPRYHAVIDVNGLLNWEGNGIGPLEKLHGSGDNPKVALENLTANFEHKLVVHLQHAPLLKRFTNKYRNLSYGPYAAKTREELLLRWSGKVRGKYVYYGAAGSTLAEAMINAIEGRLVCPQTEFDRRCKSDFGHSGRHEFFKKEGVVIRIATAS